MISLKFIAAACFILNLTYAQIAHDGRERHVNAFFLLLWLFLCSETHPCVGNGVYVNNGNKKYNNQQ